MNAYVLTYKFPDDGDGPRIIAVFATLEGAMAHFRAPKGGDWEKHDSHGTYWISYTRDLHRSSRGYWCIEEFEYQRS